MSALARRAQHPVPAQPAKREPARQIAIALVALLALSVLATTAQAQTDSGSTPSTVPIHDIQGAAHTSPYAGMPVADVPGVVTATRSNGFFMQDPSPDDDPATSEGIFVFTSAAPTVSVGDDVRVAGAVAEFRPGGGGGAGNLTTTQITARSVAVASSGNPLPTPVIAGARGRVPPPSVIDDDANGSVETAGTFDPDMDGIDFWESLEGMLVQVEDAVATGPTNNFGEIPIVSAGTAGLRTIRAGIVVRPGDFNPERVFVDDGLPGVAIPTVNVGATFSAPIVGVIDYSFGNFKLLVTGSPAVASDPLVRETTRPADANEVAIATFNVENLDSRDPQSRFDALASLIVANLQAPDLLVLEEVQDDSGAVDDGVVDAAATLARLRDAVLAAGGPTYQWRQVNPVDGQDGGEPGGNIRVVFFFRTDRGLAFVDRPLVRDDLSTTPVSVSAGPAGPRLSHSPGRVDPHNAAWSATRKPLAGEFTYNGHTLFLIGNHWSSKGGDQPLFGRFQPPALSSEAKRVQQAQSVRAFVDQLLAADPGARVVVLGDLNDFEFSPPLEVLKGRGVTALQALIETLPQEERYSYVFEGNSQSLDHILVSPGIALLPLDYDIVHVNAEFAEHASDHDPQTVRLTLAPAGRSPSPGVTDFHAK